MSKDYWTCCNKPKNTRNFPNFLKQGLIFSDSKR